MFRPRVDTREDLPSISWPKVSSDLARLCNLNPAAVICEVTNEDGTMARVPDLFQFANRFGIKMGTIKELVSFIKNSL